jgi:uncharacterized protein YbjT (DUF2867 family)
MARILVTGANGFIGKRLVYHLLDKGHEVFALVRVKGTVFKTKQPSHLKLIHGDICFPNEMEPLPEGLDAAYYLVHSMGSLVENLVEAEVAVAKTFVSLMETTSVKQIVFLGGIIENEQELSPHLSARLAVEKVLRSSFIPSTMLRASLIIGSGSASFEIIRDLCEKLPIMIAPKWVKSFCQPIGIRDVLFYLEGVLLFEASYNKTFDIGGPDAMTFKDVLQRYAKYRKLTRFIIDIPVLTPKLSSYWLVLVTSVRYSLCSYLVESMKHSTRKLNFSIDAILPHICLTYEQTLELTFQKISQNEVISTWMDAWDVKKVNKDLQNYIEVPSEGCLKEKQEVQIIIPIADVKTRIWSLGGDKGWYALNWAWRLRGLFDKLIGGIGMNRGRRHPTELQAGDTIDFWRVILADETKPHLILYAEMKLPGEAWLEFEVDREKMILRQIVTFRPKGIWGRTYWYLLMPIHLIIFKNMAHAIAQKQ